MAVSNDEKLLIARCEDLFTQCDRNAAPRFSHFLNETEQSIIKEIIGTRVDYSTCFFGGYSQAQRCIFGVFPAWQEVSESEFPISVLKITKKYKKTLSHRDYLGTVLSKGIERNKVGDILIDGDDAYIYIMSDIAELIAVGIDKIANVGVKVSVETPCEIVPPEPEFEIINTVSASLRIDAVVAAILNISRKNASDLIAAERVNVDHLPVSSNSYLIKPGQIISVRGFGRFVFVTGGEKTRSQRLHIQVKKYI